MVIGPQSASKSPYIIALGPYRNRNSPTGSGEEALFSAAEPAPLKSLADAEAAAQTEMAKLKGRTETEIVKKLGKPSNRTTWKYKGKDEPVYEYKVGKSAMLRLYFFEGKVVTASLAFNLLV